MKLAAGMAAHPVQATMTFSSAAALFGAPGQANYAAANAALEAFSELQAAQGVATVAVQWGAWAAGEGFIKVRIKGGILLDPVMCTTRSEFISRLLSFYCP